MNRTHKATTGGSFFIAVVPALIICSIILFAVLHGLAAAGAAVQHATQGTSLYSTATSTVPAGQ